MTPLSRFFVRIFCGVFALFFGYMVYHGVVDDFLVVGGRGQVGVVTVGQSPWLYRLTCCLYFGLAMLCTWGAVVGPKGEPKR